MDILSILRNNRRRLWRANGKSQDSFHPGGARTFGADIDFNIQVMFKNTGTVKPGLSAKPAPPVKAGALWHAPE